MRVNMLSSFLLSLTALCAGTLAYESNNISPESTPLSARKLLKRNVSLMLQSTTGLRTEQEVQQMDLVAWSQKTMEVCLDHINSTTPITNPAGVTVCYNLPLLISDTGTFTADFRLIRVAKPTGEWNDVGEDMEMMIRYERNSAAVKSRELSEREQEATEVGSRGATVEVLADYQFIGTISPRIIADSPSDEELKVILMPEVTVLATTTSGKKLSTLVNVNETSFLTGVFSNTADLATTEAEAILNVPFELPGTRIEIRPTGLYVFSAYLVVALGIFGWGTMDRAKFRDQYRKRMAQQGPSRR